MAYMCEICDKKTVVGRSQRHGRGIAGRRWKNRAQMTRRLFKPNLQTVSFKINEDKVQQMKVCAKCLKRVNKYGSIADYKNIATV